MPTIRPIMPADNAAMARIIRQSLKSYGLDIPGTAYFDKELDHLSDFYAQSPKRQYFVVVNDHGEVLGGNGIAEYDFPNGVAELQKLYLTETARGHHLSYQLLDAAVEFAKAAGYHQLYLETQHNLTTAIHLYQSYGFTDLGHPLNTAEHSAMDRFFVMPL